jgi:hypothetical protein
MTHSASDLRESAEPLSEGPVDRFQRVIVDNLYEGVYYVDPARRIRF